MCGKESFKSGIYNNSYNDDSNEVVAPLNELHGKLATANLRAKAKKLKKAMTEEERKEVPLINLCQNSRTLRKTAKLKQNLEVCTYIKALFRSLPLRLTVHLL